MTPISRRLQTVALLAATLVACQSSTGPVLSQSATAPSPGALRQLAAAAVPSPAGQAPAAGPVADVATGPTGVPGPGALPPTGPILGPAPLPPAALVPGPAPAVAIDPGRTADPGARTLALAEARMDVGQSREALDLLDRGPLPAETADLVALRRGELALALGDQGRARAELTAPALAQTRNRILLVRAAAALEQVGEPTRAADLWLRAVGQPSWTIDRVLARRNAAIDYARAGQPDAAATQLAALADAAVRGAPASTGLEAVAALGWHHAGLVALIDGRPADAAAAFRRYLADQPSGDYALMASRRLAALQASSAGDADGWSAARDQDSAEGYRAWIEAHPDSPRRPEARFRQGLALYRGGDPHAAIDVWSGWVTADAAAEPRARALYWTGKALAELGDADGAAACWRTAAAIRPSTYYAVRAADRLAGVFGWPDGGTGVPAAAPSAVEEAELQSWLSGWAPPAGPSEAEAGALRRADLFAAVGLEQTAGAERLDGLVETSANPRTLLAAGRTALAQRLWHAAARAGVKLGQLGPAGSGAESPAAVRRMAYPAAYAEIVAGEAGRRGVGPLLLLSLMRQESLFDRFARSIVDARGLTQVMPSTGAGIARARGQGFSPDDLYDPSLSVSFGAGYVADQLTYFGGDVFRAVAAYNAGAGAASRWAPGAGDPDLFVESIAYAETREYVKSIYQYHAAYRSLVARSG